MADTASKNDLSLTEAFDSVKKTSSERAIVIYNSGYHFERHSDNPFCLDIYFYTNNARRYTTYDFLTRVMTVSSGYVDGGITVTPFSQLDREVLDFLREKLIDLGGKPPALPALPVEKPPVTRLDKRAPQS